MSEVATRNAASRGRGSGRGGRGGHAGRGGRRANGDKPDTKSTESSNPAFDEDSDVAELRKQYGSKIDMIKELFPDWSDVDLLFALQETNGDENEAVNRIAEGAISRWGEVSKPKKAPRPKAKEAPAPTASTEASSVPSTRSGRGGRGASEGARGRGRATERGGRGGRGRSSQPAPNGTRSKENQPLSVPTEESPAFTEETTTSDAVETPAESIKSAAPAAPAAPAAKTWASMLRQSTVPKVQPKPKEPVAPAPIEPIEPLPSVEVAPPEPEPVAAEEQPTPVAEPAVPIPAAVIEPEVALSPSQDELTKKNLEKVVDDSQPPATGTAASTAADSWDPRQNHTSTNVTPLSVAQQQTPGRQLSSGYATSAIKATAERVTRTPSSQRRILDQEEAVRMPGNREVDRAAVRFGAFNLNDGEEDVDGDREDPETRTQPPADSPVAHPRASLPPVAQPAAIPEGFSQKPAAAGPPASGLPPTVTTKAMSTADSTTAPTGPAALAAQSASQAPGPHGQQFGRFGHTGAQDIPGAPQKPLDPFNQQSTPSTQPPFDNFSAQTTQPPSQQPGGAFSSAQGDYSSYYSMNQQERNPYAYYAQYGQHAGQGQQDSVPGQQRPFGAYNASQQSDNLSQYPQSGAGIHNQPRFGSGNNETQNSGHSTPNPTAQAQAQQQQVPGQQGAPGSQPQSHNQYGGYSQPYYGSPYYQQYYSGYGQGGFPYGKAGMYGQPFGVSPNAPFDHANSPASFAQSSLHRGDSGLGEYGRAGSGQGGNAQGLGGSGFGSAHDSFARGASSFQSQGQAFNSQSQGATATSNEDLKPFGESTKAGGAGPSPSLGGARPGSATATAGAPAGQGSGLPPQSSQMGGGAYAGYPSHLQNHNVHGNSGYGMSGAGGPNQHGNTPYGSYGQGGFGSGGAYYGGGQQQQRGGWGGNYH